MADYILDARGLDCPQPIIQTRKKLNELESGQTLMVMATDPGSVLDFMAYCRISRNELLEMTESEEEFVFLIQKATPHDHETEDRQE